MATNTNDHSEPVQNYIDIELEDSFEFENRLSPDEDDALYDSKRLEVDNSENDSE